MLECSIPEGESPTVEIIGDKQAKYILSIDPNYGDGESSDYFSMALLKMDDETRIPLLVPGYGETGEVRKHHSYFFYLFTHFNIEMIVIDNAGSRFIQELNETALFHKHNLAIKEFEFDSTAEGLEYVDQCKIAREKYNKGDKCIAFRQVFHSKFIRDANEFLKTAIDYKKIRFASSLRAHDNLYSAAVALIEGGAIDLDLVEVEGSKDSEFNEKMTNFIDKVSLIPYETKKQCSIIQISTTNLGTLSYDIPGHLKKGGKHKTRKDNYTALLLGVWANKCYYDIISKDYDDVDVMPMMTNFRNRRN